MNGRVSVIVSDLSGGGAVRAFLLGQVLHKLDYSVQIIGFRFGAELYAQPPQGMEVVAIPGATYPKFGSAVQQLRSQLDGNILYAVKPKPTSFGVALLEKLIVNSRPVLLDMDDWEMSWHGGDAWRYRPSPKQFARDVLKPGGELRNPDHPLYVRWTEHLVRFADAVTIDTEFLQQRFGGVYLPNGKDTDLFDPALYDAEDSRQKYGLAEYRVLMFPGAPRPHKGVEDVLMALDQMDDPMMRLVIVGGSPYDDYDDRLIEQWGRWIIKLPRAPVEQMPEVLAAAHVVVVPQRDTLTAQAQFPLKLTDGMAMAKPVLSTRVGDIPTILADQAGYLVDPGCPDQIAAQLRHIFENLADAQARGQRARDRCVQYYSVHTMAHTLSTVLSAVLSAL